MSEADILKQKLENAIADSIKKYYENTNTKAFSRNRKLDLSTLIHLILSMDGSSNRKEILRHNLNCSDAALCQRRQKISSDIFEDIFHKFNELCEDTKRYKNYRCFAIDGTNIPIATNASSDTYLWTGSPKSSYSAYHLTPIYDIVNGAYMDAVIQPKSKFSEIAAAEFLLSWCDFPEKSILILDRGFESYNMIGLLKNTSNCDFVMRVKQSATAMRVIKTLPMEKLDIDVSVVITLHHRKSNPDNYVFIQTGSLKGKENSKKTVISKWYFGDLYELTFRVVRDKIPNTDTYETIITSLDRQEFSAADIFDLYKRRWKIEVNAFRNLKYTIGLMNQHQRKDDLCKQQIWASLIMQNFCSRIISSIDVPQKEENKYEYAIDYKMAVSLCKEFFRTPNADGEKLLKDISKYVVPVRPDRQEDRNLKAKSFSGFCYRIP